jgi:hypothetical protein
MKEGFEYWVWGFIVFEYWVWGFIVDSVFRECGSIEEKQWTRLAVKSEK